MTRLYLKDNDISRYRPVLPKSASWFCLREGCWSTLLVSCFLYWSSPVTADEGFFIGYVKNIYGDRCFVFMAMGWGSS